MQQRDTLLGISTPGLKGFPIDVTFTRVIAGEELRLIERQMKEAEDVVPMTGAI